MRVVTAVVALSVMLLASVAHAADPDAWRRAISRADFQALDQQLAAGFRDVDLSISSGKTALMLAARHGEYELASKLLTAGASPTVVNHNGGTPLMHAAVGGDKRIVALLLERGGAVDAIARNGWTALTLAAAKGHAPVVRQLLVTGADPNIKDVYGWTPLMRAVEQQRLTVVSVLTEEPQIDINARNVNGATALHRAAAQGFAEIGRVLLDRGADASLADHEGRTAQDYARESGHTALLAELSPSSP